MTSKTSGNQALKDAREVFNLIHDLQTIGREQVNPAETGDLFIAFDPVPVRLLIAEIGERMDSERFYGALGYLRKNGLIKKQQLENHAIYCRYQTPEGKVVAFNDMPPVFISDPPMLEDAYTLNGKEWTEDSQVRSNPKPILFRDDVLAWYERREKKDTSYGKKAYDDWKSDYISRHKGVKDSELPNFGTWQSFFKADRP